LSCADANPLNMSVVAAASKSNFVIAKTSSTRIARRGRNGLQTARTRVVSAANSRILLWFRARQIF
jgi:hypothetical protein